MSGTQAWLPPSTATADPEHVAASETTAAAAYRPGDPVAVRIDGNWWPGIVAAADEVAVRVTWRLPGGGTAVDTLTAQYLRRLTETGKPS